MITLDSILPSLEHAVRNHVECEQIASLEPSDLRHLIYKLVERQRALSLNATEHFRELVEAAALNQSDLFAARASSVSVRAELLRQLLSVLKPALPSLLGQIVVHTEHRIGDHDVTKHHPFLRGFGLINGVKTGSVSRGVTARSGSSWWIVAIPGESPDDPVDARYARLYHSGQISDGVGDTWSDITIVTSDEAAAKMRDYQVAEVLKRIHERLVNLTGKGVVKATDDLWSVTNALSSALDAMREPVRKAQ